MQDNRTGNGDLTFLDNSMDLKRAIHKKKMLFGSDSFQEVKTELTPLQIDNKKIGRNNPCGCGSGKKFKKCCWTGKKLQ